MACLRESPAKGRWGAVQCDEEGCQFRCDEITCSGELVGTSPTSHCLLQLRLRAGDVAKLGIRDDDSDEVKDEIRRNVENIMRDGRQSGRSLLFTEEELVQFITGHLNLSLSTSQRYWVAEYFKENPGITHHDTSDTRGL